MSSADNAKVSIAMATYNGEKYIEEQLASLQAQTCKADEVIIVDDCSADSTPHIVSEFITKHNLDNWKLTIRTENQGYARTFRQALSQTTGDIIFLCDQDDVWLPEKIEIMKNTMTANSKICMLSCSDIMVNEFLKPLSSKPTPSPNGYITKHIRKSDINVIGTCIRLPDFSGTIGCLCAVTRSLCNKYLQMPIYTTAHDYALARLAEAECGYFFINLSLVYYRRHLSNVTDPNSSGNKESEVARRLYMLGIEMKDWKDLPIIFDSEHISNSYFNRIKRTAEIRCAFLEQSNMKTFFPYVLLSVRRPWKLKQHLRLLSDVYYILKEKQQKKGS